MLTKASWGAAALAACVALSGPVSANDGRISVIGEGQVSVVPDLARLNLGVEAQDATAAGALAAVATQMDGIMGALSGGGIAPRDMQTSQLSVQPVYDQMNDRQSPPQVVAYEARTDVMVRVRDLDGLGALLDSVAKAGGNRFQGLNFDVQDRAPFLAQARQAAVADGLAKAALYAGAAGVGLGPIVELAEDGATDAPMPMMEAASFRSMPIAAGEIEIGARLRMVFEIGD